jgi:hypothetical protein
MDKLALFLAFCAFSVIAPKLAIAFLFAVGIWAVGMMIRSGP